MLIKYLIGIIAALGLGIGGYFYGVHNGKQSGELALQTAVAKLNQAAADQLRSALAQQSIQDQQRLAATQAAMQSVINANTKAVVDAANLRARLAVLAKVPANKAWLDEIIPSGIKGVINGQNQ